MTRDNYISIHEVAASLDVGTMDLLFLRYLVEKLYDKKRMRTEDHTLLRYNSHKIWRSKKKLFFHILSLVEDYHVITTVNEILADTEWLDSAEQKGLC